MNNENNSASANRLPVSREQLYQEVWAEPMTTVALKYKVSSSFLARVCTALNVPRPARGYWAMLAAGKKMTRPPLPVAQPGNELEWSRDGYARRVPLPQPKPPEKNSTKRIRRKNLPESHSLLEGAKDLMVVGRESDAGFLKPRKRLLPDIITSKESLARALDVANDLYMLLEKRGYTVDYAPNGLHLRRYAVDDREKGGSPQNYSDLWWPSRCTIVMIGTVAIGLTIFEMSENVEVKYQDGKYTRISDLPAQKPKRYESYSWTSTHDMPSGRFCVQAYSPYHTASWQRQWRETKAGDFPRKLAAIAKELQSESATIARLVEEGERKAEIERQRQEARYQEWLREEEIKRRNQAFKDSREEIFNIIAAWAEAKRVEEFFADAEKRAANLAENEKEIILERLRLARKMVGDSDALRQFRSWRAPDER